ncbi:IS630 family transposase [Lewinella sp. 4G2]|uniref:IS630 family transposase n=1 Tax=Lewinella sp. 4G2 TaxID=1803372 RepID=UPI0007B4712E|nr:IS630 family transposase [Lewinella sp. 4G2]OAV43234.1 hypothetical protein A3850_001410 [Lewinella sp. 4G2]
MSLILTKDELEALQLEQNTAGLSKRRYRKVTVLIMLHQGHSVKTIEAALGIDDNTIYRYQRAYYKAGLSDFLDDSYVAYTGRLTDKQEEALAKHLDDYLYPDAKSIAAYVLERFGVDYSVGGMTDLLHRLGFVFKKSKSVPAKADEEAQRAFVEEELPALLEEVATGDAVVYYADGCHPTHNTKTSRGWIRKGEDFEVDCNNGRQRVNINAAVNALKPEHLVYEIADTINAQSTQRLCRQLLRKHPGKKIYFICDNARYNRNKMLTEWADGQRIEFVYLPTYSPNLNLIERLWHFMRVKVLNSTYYEKSSEFEAAIVSFLGGIKLYKEELRSLLTLNFRTVGGTSVHLSQTSS